VPGAGVLDICKAELQCQTPVAVDFATGVRVTLPQSGLVECTAVSEPDPTSQLVRLDCNASGSFGARSYTVVSKGLAAACQPVVAHYLEGTEPKFDGAKACLVRADDAGSGSCFLEETCFDAAPLSGGVSAVKTPSKRMAFCSLDDVKTLACGCTFGDQASVHASISYGMGKASPPVQCDLSECTPDMRADATAQGACQAQVDTLVQDENSCLDSFSCTQPAKLAGRAVDIWSQLNVRCERGPDQAFYCGCAAGLETATFRAGALATSADACELAGSACLEHLALPLGPAPVAGAPPDPLLDR
jgi:hypothetical protein